MLDFYLQDRQTTISAPEELHNAMPSTLKDQSPGTSNTSDGQFVLQSFYDTLHM